MNIEQELSALETELAFLSNPKEMESIACMAMDIVWNKIQYYMFDNPILTDLDYDILERKYAAACEAIGIEPILDIVGVDMSMPIFQGVYKTMTGKAYAN